MQRYSILWAGIAAFCATLFFTSGTAYPEARWRMVSVAPGILVEMPREPTREPIDQNNDSKYVTGGRDLPKEYWVIRGAEQMFIAGSSIIPRESFDAANPDSHIEKVLNQHADVFGIKWESPVWETKNQLRIASAEIGDTLENIRIRIVRSGHIVITLIHIGPESARDDGTRFLASARRQ